MTRANFEQSAVESREPQTVQKARATIRAWEARLGHDSYVDCLDGGYAGYQARCWDCDWAGPEHLRGEEELGTPESRLHKQRAKEEAAQHQIDTREPTRHGWMHWDGLACMEPAWCQQKHYKTPEVDRAA